MKVVCLDTNAILDLCYRYYPENSFPSLWVQLQASLSATQMKFVVSEHIYSEITEKIRSFDYDATVFNDFIQKFQVQTIPIKDYEISLLNLKSKLINYVDNSTKLVKTIDKLDNDFSNICVAGNLNGCVLTSEQGFGRDLLTAKTTNDIKIPDTCTWQGIDCYNWIGLLNYLGVSI